jgi:hypothetical protein
MDMPARRWFPLLFVLAAGCGDASTAPRTAKPIDTGPAAPDLPPIVAPKPAKSDPAAALALNAILLAHTENEPSRLERLRKVQIRRKGVFRMPEASSNASMEIQIWGDQYRAKIALEANGNLPTVYWVSGSDGWHLPPMQPARLPLNLAERENVFPDVRGDQMTLLVPLASDRVVAEIARPASQDRGVMLRVWVGDWPPVLVSVDAKTGRLDRLVYEAMDAGRKVERTLRLADYAPIAGVQLPQKVLFGIGDRAITTWDKIEYEVPGQFEIGIFDKP